MSKGIRPWLIAMLAGLTLSSWMTPTYADAPSGYYSSVDASSSSSLRSTLHPVIDDHTRYPYSASSTDTWDILEDADEDADDSSSVTTIYKNASYSKQGGGNNYYNREHSWPKSYGFPNDGRISI